MDVGHQVLGAEDGVTELFKHDSNKASILDIVSYQILDKVMLCSADLNRGARHNQWPSIRPIIF
jgi:hypothetical protein